MSTPLLGEIRMFAGSFAPRGWAFCNGQELDPQAYPDLFRAIGTTYGGDGKATFALPDLRGRVPVHNGRGFANGDRGGAEYVSLTTDQLPGHAHTGAANIDAVAVSQGLAVAESIDPTPIAGRQGDGFALAAGADSMHENVQPYLSLHFIIALSGDVEPVSMEGPIVGEVRIFAGRGVPAGWRRCDGQSLVINEHPGLFAILGTTYGGDGVSGFCLPDLRERVAIHAGQGEGLTLRKLGEAGGSSTVDLKESQLPYHSHQLTSANNATAFVLTDGVHRNGSVSSADPAAPGNAHNNLQPYLVMNYLIATRGSE